MNEARETYAELFKLANKRVKTSSAWEKALPYLLGGGALAIGTPLAYRLGKKKGVEEEEARKPWTFGAGALTGLVAPHILKQLKSSVGLGLNPEGGNGLGYDEFSEF